MSRVTAATPPAPNHSAATRWHRGVRRLYESPPSGLLFVAAVAVVSVAVVISHRPDAVTRPQFFAEDGLNWYAEVYKSGPFAQFFTPYAGYLQIVSRIVAGLSLLVPVGSAPLVFAIAAIICQVLPAVFLASTRLSPLIPNSWVRLGLAFIYLASPGASGIDAILTDAQWHLAVLSFLILIAPRPTRWTWLGLDLAALLIAGLSGPFALFLAPLALSLSLRRRDKQQWVVTAVVWAAATITAAVLALNLVSERSTLLQHTHGALLTAVEIVGLRVVMVGVIGTREAAHLQLVGGSLALTMAAATGVVLGAVAFYYATFEGRLFLLYGLISTGAALVAEHSIWPLLLGTGGSQYWFIPILAWILSLVVLTAKARPYLLRVGAALLCVCFVIYGTPHDWVYPPMANEHFQRSVSELAHARPGQRVLFNEDPPGYRFVLVKK